MENQINYYRIDRAEWRNFYKDHIVPLTNEELDRIKSLNDRISMEDVSEVYMPMVHLLQMFMKNHQRLQDDQASFLGIKPHKVPFILGIAGSVAVGKSTTARLLKSLLSEVYPNKKVQLITTDGFIFPNAVLKKKGIMSRKGFPESYDMERLIQTLNEIKSGKDVKIPLYSHQVYDIVPGEFETIAQPDILIVEGINTLQLPANQQIYVSDFFDFSIFVDADPTLIETWYLERFESLLDTAFLDPKNYYYQFAIGDREKALQMSRSVWKNVNLKNLEEFILPTRGRADIILHKQENHLIDQIYLRKH